MRIIVCPCLSVWYSQYPELHAELKVFYKSHIEMEKQIILFHKRIHSLENQFFKDSVKITQQRNWPIIIWISIVICFKDRNNLCHL